MPQQPTGTDRLQSATENVVDAVNTLAERVTTLATELDNLRYVVTYLRSWEDSPRRVRVTREAESDAA